MTSNVNDAYSPEGVHEGEGRRKRPLTGAVKGQKFGGFGFERATLCNLHSKIARALNAINDFLKHSGSFQIALDKPFEYRPGPANPSM